MGADPVALSSGIASRIDDSQNTLQVFTVRKAAKDHGRQKRIEGNFAKGDSVVVVMMSSQANPLDAELISLTMTAVSHFREIFALSQQASGAIAL